MISALLGRAFQLVFALLGVRVMTTVLSPHEVGKVAVITTVINLCVLIFISPVGTFINRRLHSWHKTGKVSVYFGWYAIYLLIVASICASLLVAATSMGWLLLDLSLWGFAAVVWGSIFFGTLHQTLIPSLNLLGRDKPFALLSTLSAALALCISVGLTAFWGAPVATDWVAGVVVAQMFFAVVAARVFFDGADPPTLKHARLNWGMVKTAWQFAWPVAIAVACSWLHFQGYRLVLADAVGLDALGVFVAGYGIAAALFAALEQVLTTWFLPRFYKQVDHEQGAESSLAWGQYASSVMSLSILAFAALLHMADTLVHWMLGAGFQGALGYVRWAACAELTRVIVGVYALLAHQSMRTRDLIVPHFLGALIAFGLACLFADRLMLNLVPLGLMAGNWVVIGILRYAQNPQSKLPEQATSLLLWAVFLAMLVSGADALFGWFFGAVWMNESMARILCALLMWGAAGLYLLRRVLAFGSKGNNS